MSLGLCFYSLERYHKAATVSLSHTGYHQVFGPCFGCFVSHGIVYHRYAKFAISSRIFHTRELRRTWQVLPHGIPTRSTSSSLYHELNVKASQRLHRKSARSALAAFRQKSIDGVSLATTVGMRRGEDDGKEGGGQNEDQKENVERCLPPAEI